MKSFDLTAAINGAKLVTRDGREVTEFYYFKTRSVYKVVAIIDGDLCAFLDNGMTDNRRENNLDLFLKPEKKELFIAIKKEKQLNTHATSHAHEEKRTLDFPENDWQIVEVEIEI